MAAPSRFALGARTGTLPLSAASAVGTVRYVGGVDNHEGTYVGVEWDDATRGKHDGEVEGKRYFTCENHEAGVKAASLVREKKVRCLPSVLEAIHERYRTEDDAPADEEASAGEFSASLPASRWRRCCGS